MKKILLVFAAFLACSMMKAQETKTPEWGIKFSGFVNTDYFYDTRQVVCARQGHFMLWPAAEKPDPNGEDINAKSSYNLLSIRTRLKGSISGPDVLGAKTSAVIEGSFFGHSNLDLNEFRLRHAYSKMNWEKTELLIGQYWHPMFITSCFPSVLSFNTGAPFQPFSRNPQIRLTHILGDLSVSATAFAHTDFVGAAGISGHRNASVPEMHFQAMYSTTDSEKGTGFLVGGGAGYKRLVPVLESAIGYKTSESAGSYMTEVYMKLTMPKLIIKAEGTYGQNNYDMLMISSYAANGLDPLTGIMKYTSTASYSAWGEIMTTGKTWQTGVFAGYTKSLGAGENIIAGTVAGTRGNIDYIYRVSPRLQYNVGKMSFGLELEYSVAAFGTIDTDGSVVDSTPAGNFRALMGVFYYF